MRPIIPSLKIIEPTFGNSFSLSNRDQNIESHSNSWHYHPEIELVYIHGGSGKRQVGNHISYFNNGDLILIGSNLPHCGFIGQESENKRETVIQLKPDFLGTTFLDLPEMANIKTLFHKADQGISFGQETITALGPRLKALSNQPQMERLLGLIAILNELAITNDSTLLHAKGSSIEMQMQDNDRMNMVYNYVKEHFQENISLDDIAELVAMTVPSFCRYFKKITNKTFTKFVNDYRLVHASKLLAEKPISITEISYESGFNNFGHFNKSFKDFTGKSASQYRQELRSYIG